MGAFFPRHFDLFPLARARRNATNTKHSAQHFILLFTFKSAVCPLLKNWDLFSVYQDSLMQLYVQLNGIYLDLYHWV